MLEKKFEFIAGLSSISSIAISLIEALDKNYAMAGIAFFMFLFVSAGSIVLYRANESKKKLGMLQSEFDTYKKNIEATFNSSILESNEKFSILNEFQFLLLKIINKYNTKQREIADRFQDGLDEIEAKLEKIDNPEKEASFVLAEELKKQSIVFLEDIYKSFKEHQKRLFKEVVEQSQRSVEDILRLNGYNINVSFSMKLLTKPLILTSNGNSMGNEIIQTVFRDQRTHNTGEREVWEIEYKIAENTDFLHCINAQNLNVKDALFISNKLFKMKDEGTYRNENGRFREFYDSTIVAPITNHFIEDGRMIFGFLTCDAMISGTEYAGKEVFTHEEGKMLLSAANGVGIILSEVNIYLEELGIEMDQRNASA